MGNFGSEVYIQLGAALVFILAAIGVLALILRRTGLGARLSYKRGRQRRLAIVEAAPLDSRRRLVLIKRDGVEHLLLLGPQGDLAIETAIPPPPQAVDPRDRSAEPTLSAAPAALAVERKL